MGEPAIRTRASDLLGVRYPILQAPMGYIARAQLAGRIDSIEPVSTIVERTVAEFREALRAVAWRWA